MKKDKNILKVIPVIRFEICNKENSFFIPTNLINDVLIVLKNHFKYQFKVLTAISGIDYPEKEYRFQIVYELLSLKFNTRLRLKILTNELNPIVSIKTIFSGASWWECEIWDMLGVYFTNQQNLTRLLTDYGFQGHPLRKDFPLSGFTEPRYDNVKHKIVHESIELTQECRNFEFLSPWENHAHK